MKKMLTRILSFSCCIVMAAPGNASAQFFKDMLNTVKQTAQSRANSKTSQTTNKVLDQADTATHLSSGSKSTGTVPTDTASTNRVLGAFARAAAANPNDTSSSDLTMKALGMLAGGHEISAQDSARVISSFKTSSGGSGIEYLYSITMTGKNNATSKDSMHIYFTNGGEGRVEMRIPIPGVKMNEMISIGHFDQRGYSVLLYPDSKTYNLNIIDTAMLTGNQTYQVTRIGTETVNGYSCTHARMVSTMGTGMFKSSTTTDIWTSSSIPGYALYQKMTSLQTTKPGMMQALDKAGCSGLFVRMTVTGKDSNMQEDMISAKEKNLSADLFRIPSGYTESKGNMFSNMMMPATKK